MYCKYCGTKLDKESKFCNKCGKSIESNITSTTDINNLGRGKAVASLVIGIISILFGGIIFPLPLIGLILGCSYKGKCSEKTAGIILNVIGLVISLIATIICIIIICVALSGAFNGSFINIDSEDIGQWSDYSYYVDQNDALDTTDSIVGSWKELQYKRSYYVINENDFYFYSDMNNMESNYVYGTYELYSGVEELSKINIKGKFFNRILDEIIKEFEKQNFYLIKFNPVVTIENGEEVNKTYNEDDLYKALFIENQNGVIELTISEENESKTKHYYKVLE